MTILWDLDPSAAEKYQIALGTDVRHFHSVAQVARALEDGPQESLIVVGPDIPLDSACDLAETQRVERPHIGVVLLRHRLDVTVLGHALRSGVREVVQSDDQGSLGEAIRRSELLTSQLGGLGSGGAGDGKVVTVFSAKGGVGKTTVATNIATYLAASGLRTLLVDLDLMFGDVAISLQLSPHSSLIDVAAMSGHIDKQGIDSVAEHHEVSGLDIISAPSDPADADRVPAHVIVELLRVARSHYDFVVVDTPPSFTEHVLAAFDVSDLTVLIATLDIPAVKNLRIAIATLDTLGAPSEARVVVLNRADAKVGLSPDDVEIALKQQISAKVPNSLSVPASVNRGVTLVLQEPRHPVSVALKRLVDEVIRERLGMPVPSEANGHRRGVGLLRSRR